MKDNIRRLIMGEINRGELAGASILVIQKGKELMREQFGYADIDTKEPIRPDSIFRLFSMTKPITSAAVMMLWERGMLDLVDPVSKYLEDFANQKVLVDGKLVPCERENTIRDLLNMTSGLVYPDDKMEPERQMKKVFDEGKGVMSTVDFCNAIGRVPLAFQPGEQWRYGTSADVLAAIVEVVSGQSYRSFLKENLLDPLGMVDTDFYVPAEKWDRFTTMYRYHNDAPKLTKYTDTHLNILDYKTLPLFESGGAGLVSTVDDYAKFAKMLLNKGTYDGISYLGRKTVDYMRTNHLTEEQRKYMNWSNQLLGYGYGQLMRVMVDLNIGQSNGSLGEYGWDGWPGTYMAIDPEEELIILYFIQRVDREYTLRREIRNVIYGSLK